MDDDRPRLPAPHTARDLDFDPCEYVSPACMHRHHNGCDDGCRYCAAMCLCVCHRWKIPIQGGPVEKA